MQDKLASVTTVRTLAMMTLYSRDPRDHQVHSSYKQPIAQSLSGQSQCYNAMQ